MVFSVVSMRSSYHEAPSDKTRQVLLMIEWVLWTGPQHRMLALRLQSQAFPFLRILELSEEVPSCQKISHSDFPGSLPNLASFFVALIGTRPCYTHD